MNAVSLDQVEPRQAIPPAIRTGIVDNERHPLANPTFAVTRHPMALDVCGDCRLGVGGHAIDRLGKYRLDARQYRGHRERCQRCAGADGLGLRQSVNGLPLYFDFRINVRVGREVEKVAERGSSRTERLNRPLGRR